MLRRQAHRARHAGYRALPALAIVVAMLTAALLGAEAARAQTDWPNRPVRIIIPFAAGASTDSLVRGVAEKLQASLNQPFVVENRGGAAGALGTELAAKAQPDGYTILMTPQSPIVVLPSLRKTGYDPLKDFIHVDRLGQSIAGIAVHPSVGARTLAEFIALAKKNPGKFTFVSAGVGTVNHMRGEMLKLQAGIDMLHIPYKGTGEALADLLAGNVSLMFESSVFPHVKSGKLVLLAMLDERSPEFPDVLSMGEAGFPDFDLPIWTGAYLPRGTPQAIVEKLHGELAKIHGDKDLAEKLEAAGIRLYPKSESLEVLATRLAAETERFADLIKKAGIKLD